MKRKNIHGISLMILVITIVVITILASTIVISLDSIALISTSQDITNNSNLYSYIDSVRTDFAYFQSKNINLNYEDYLEFLKNYGELEKKDNSLILKTKYGNINPTVIYNPAQPDYLELDLSAIEPGQPFSLYHGELELNQRTFFADIDISNLDRSIINQNLISIGEDVDIYNPRHANQVNLHFFYPNEDGNLIVSAVLNKLGGYQFTYTVGDATSIKIAFNTNGLYINGSKLMDNLGLTSFSNLFAGSSSYVKSTLAPTFFERWNSGKITADIASLEGDSRSTANYNSVRVYNTCYTTTELKSLTKIKKDSEAPIIDYKTLDVSAIEPNQPFSLYEGPFIASSQTLFASLDITDLDKSQTNQCILSFGGRIDTWYSPNVNVHMYFPTDDGKLILALVFSTNHIQTYVPITSNTTKIKISFNKFGLFINGNKVFDSTGLGPDIRSFAASLSPNEACKKTMDLFIAGIDIMEIGSIEGSTRSNATYEKVLIYSTALLPEDLINLTITD